MSSEMVGLTGLILLFVLMACRVPIAYSFGLIGLVGCIYFTGFKAGATVIGLYAWSQTISYTLMSLPLFVMMGSFIGVSGLGADLYAMFHRWIGHVTGGLYTATIGACALFAAASGSSLASVLTMGTIAYPQMMKYGYDRKVATGTIATAGTLAILIPPSTNFIIYAAMTEVSVGRLFIAGIFPGIMLAVSLALMVFIRCKLNPNLGPAAPPSSWEERFRSLPAGGMVMVIFFIVIGGIYWGWFTATEASAIGAFAALLLAFARKKVTGSNFLKVMKSTGRTTSMVFLIIILATFFGHFLGLSRLPMAVANYLNALPVSRTVLMALILAIYIPLGCVMEVVAMLVLTVPIFFPTVVALGYDPIWFGICVTMLSELAQITPPVGLAVFVIKGITQDTSIEEVFSGITPFALTICANISIIFVFPQIALFLPTLMKG